MSTVARYESILAALHAASVRYVIAGGFAVDIEELRRIQALQGNAP